MSPHLKAPAAEVAGEGLESGVLPAVGDQVRRLTEGLAAHHALVRFLPCEKIQVTIRRTNFRANFRLLYYCLLWASFFTDVGSVKIWATFFHRKSYMH
jgi:hypothetical protein